VDVEMDERRLGHGDQPYRRVRTALPGTTGDVSTARLGEH
jgi:hypothetical protein